MVAAVLQAPPDVPLAEARRIPGNKGIWAGITCEFVEFAVLFAVYFVSRAHFSEAFHDGAQRLSVVFGTLITLLMITSSYFIACSVNAMLANCSMSFLSTGEHSKSKPARSRCTGNFAVCIW